MSINVKIIRDSISKQGIRLTTMQLRYPRFIHAEFMTHRVFSRNASSSRAIPVERLIADIERDPAMPIHWGKNQPGMQAQEELTGDMLGAVKRMWLESMMEAVRNAQIMIRYGAHKQIVNRVLEPYSHINVLVTATDYENFYTLRRHPDAQPEIHALADAMWEAQQVNVPLPLDPGQWHLPYVRPDETSLILEIQQKLSVARCARVSYLTHEGKTPSIEEDLKLYNRLMGSVPLHASPAEHQATPDQIRSTGISSRFYGWWYPELHGNFKGWKQFRKMIE